LKNKKPSYSVLVNAHLQNNTRRYK